MSASGSGRQAPLRLAVIGVGGMAHWQHLPNLRALGDEAQLVAMVDVSSERLAAVAAAYQVANTYRDVDALLRAGLDLQAALVLTPPPHHAAPTIALLRAGVPVFCEKPLSYREAEAEEMVRVAEETGTTFMVGYNRRFAATLLAAKETLAAARPELVLAEKSKPVPPGSRHRLLESAIHAVDALRWLAGSEVESLQALGTADQRPEQEQSVAALIRFAGGTIGVFAMNAHGAKWVERYEVYADVATMLIEYPVRLRRFTREPSPLRHELAALLATPPAEREIGTIDGEPVLQLEGACYPVDEVAALGFRAELAHFLSCVRHGLVPLVGGADALATQRLAGRILRAAGLELP